MDKTQYLIFEASPQCHLGQKHPWCPNTHPERYAASGGLAPLSDDRIVEAVAEAHALGFAGLVGWHYYNEPLCAWWRVRPLMQRIRTRVPQCRWVLWTNGVQLPTDRAELGLFEEMNLTDYTRVSGSLGSLPCRLVRRPVSPDARRDATPLAAPSRAPCRRMFSEMIFDYFGRCHVCCHDWRGTVAVGNVATEPFAEIAGRWSDIREAMAGEAMLPDAPAACRHCALRSQAVTEFDKPAAARARAWVAQAKAPPCRADSATVVAVAYRIPEWRVRQFCEYNRAEFARRGVRTVLVVEQPYDLPSDIVQLPFPFTLPVFNLARTKNHGIRWAVEHPRGDGPAAIIGTDIDIVFPPEALDACCGVRYGRAAIPLHRMIDTPEAPGKPVDAPKATGTVAMAADLWRDIQYDERCLGYGSDDACLLADIAKGGIGIDARDLPVLHLAHSPGSCQAEFNGRADHWGRDTGFNPENFAENNAIYNLHKGGKP